MPTLPSHIKEIALKHGLKQDDFWNCHGTWVAYHAPLERAAAKAGIQWDAPQIIEQESSKAVSLIARGTLGDHTEWSIGEASPKNNKNSYPWAMAEKRAKDRVILKLLGLAGEVYSEEDSDSFKEKRMTKAEGRALYTTLQSGLRAQSSLDALKAWGKDNASEIKMLPVDWENEIRDEFRAEIEGHKAAA